MAYNIVLVDDDEKIAELLGQSLLAKGHNVKVFNDSSDAKDFFLSDDSFKVLISDNIMPKLNGCDLIAQCLIKKDQALYILATGDDSYNFLQLDTHKNVKIISKPYKRKDIIGAIGDYFKE